jgi:hypothetical protein
MVTLPPLSEDPRRTTSPLIPAGPAKENYLTLRAAGWVENADTLWQGFPRETP